MKNNLKNIFGLTSIGAAAAVLGFLACASTSHATVIVDNTSDATFTSVGGSSTTFAQEFTMSGTSFNSVQLLLSSTTGGTANVDLYSVAAGLPTGSATLLGTVTAGPGNNQLIAVTPFSVSGLTSGSVYAIVLAANSTMNWDYTLTKSLGPIADSSDGGSTWAVYGGSANGDLQMSVALVPVPEVPMTGMIMGFGALGIAMVSTMCRKIRSAGSSIA